ncbi:MAG: uracil-DNA glycosylase family protein [Bacteroidota bacterium]
MFLHQHPYEPYVFSEATKLIVGTLPPPRFTQGDLKLDDVDFCYGSRNGMLWPILNEVFDLNLAFENTAEAIDQRKRFLHQRKIGVCDIVESAERDKIDASDLGMQNVKLRDLISLLNQFENLDTLLFMGGNSKNGPEYFFRKQLRGYGISPELVSNDLPRIHEFVLPSDSQRTIKTITFTAPSGAANRAIGSLDSYKKAKQQNPKYTTFDFRVAQYAPFF